MKKNRLKKAVVLNGTAVLKLKDLKKEFVYKNKMNITYDVIIAKALTKLSYEDLIK